MSWTKQQFVEQAFTELGLASFDFDLQPEQMQTALVRLDSMVAGWNAKGIRIGWPLPSSPENSELDQETNCPDYAQEAIYLNLAIRLGPGLGRVITPDLKSNAKDAFNNLVLRGASQPIPRQYPESLPRGAGNKPLATTGQNFVTPPIDPLDAGPDGELDFN